MKAIGLEGTVLLVEDSQDDVYLMRRAFKKARIRSPLQVATDGKQAIDYLQGSGDFYDRMRYPLPYLVFLDLKLPYFHGFMVLAWIRDQAELNSVSVIVLTSSAEKQDREKAASFGAIYLVKPPTPELLHEAIRLLGLE